jgi:hypothetical protein
MRDVDQRQQKVVLETDRHRISGSVTLPTDGYRSRFSDYLNHADREFIALTDAVVAPLGSDEDPVRVEFVVVGRAHIVLAVPQDEAQS